MQKTGLGVTNVFMINMIVIYCVLLPFIRYYHPYFPVVESIKVLSSSIS